MHQQNKNSAQWYLQTVNKLYMNKTPEWGLGFFLFSKKMLEN